MVLVLMLNAARCSLAFRLLTELVTSPLYAIRDSPKARDAEDYQLNLFGDL